MSRTRVAGGGVAQNPFGVQWTGAESVGQPLTTPVEDPLFGRRKPPEVPEDEQTSALLARLHVYRKRLARLIGDSEGDYDLRLSAGTIATIDKEGLIYVGREFLTEHADDLPLQVGVIAHEIGHRPRRWAEYVHGRRLTKSEMEELCRFEETRADYFAGYALAHLNMDCTPLCDFLLSIDDGPHPEYFSAPLRAQTVREAHAAGQRRSANIRKFFPNYARMTSTSGDLGIG